MAGGSCRGGPPPCARTRFARPPLWGNPRRRATRQTPSLSCLSLDPSGEPRGPILRPVFAWSLTWRGRSSDLLSWPHDSAAGPLTKSNASPPTAHVPPQNIEAEESVLGAMLVAEPTLTRVIDEVKLNAERLLPRQARGDLHLRPRPLRGLEAGRRAQRHRGADPAQPDRGGGRQALRLRAGGQGPRRRQRQALRRDRPAELAAAPPARRRPADPGLGPRARRRTARALRAGREAALRRRPQRAGERLQTALRDPPRRGRPPREALHRRARADRHPLGLPRHRRDHRAASSRAT